MLQLTPKQKLNARIKWMLEDVQNIEEHLDDIQNILNGTISDQSDIHAIWSYLEKIDDEIARIQYSHFEAVQIANDELTIDYSKLPNPGVGYSEQYAK